MAVKQRAASESVEPTTLTEDKPVKRGRGRPKGHAPSNVNGSPLMGDGYIGPQDEKQQLISRLVRETIRTYKMPRVQSDDELEQRLAEYFQHCAETGERPTVEQMAQCTGYTPDTVYDWETGRRNGFSPDTATIIKKAKAFLRVFDAKMVAEGALNPVVYIFRAKNYYGMKDQQDLVVAPQQPLGPEPDADKLASDYLKALPAADDDLASDYPATI